MMSEETCLECNQYPTFAGVHDSTVICVAVKPIVSKYKVDNGDDEEISYESLGWREKGFSNKLVTMEVHGVTEADVLGNNPIYNNDSVVGRATGGDFGFRLNKSLALSYYYRWV